MNIVYMRIVGKGEEKRLTQNFGQEYLDYKK